MDETVASPDSCLAWGTIEIDYCGGSFVLNTSGGTPLPISVSRYTWRPPPDIAAALTGDFSLTFDCSTGPDGSRRFTPCGGIAGFIILASFGGNALLGREEALSADQRFSYHCTRLIYQIGPRLREHLDRTFAREADLYVPQAGRNAEDDGNVLPHELGLDANGPGTRWGPRDVIEQGRTEARAAGDPNPDAATCIRLGLRAAARRDPLDPATLRDAETLGLVRLALFDLGPEQARLKDCPIDTVEERLWAAVERHAEDDIAAFNRWFFDNVDNIVHAIAKQKRDGGPIPRESVRQALLELVFRSFMHVGDCVHRQMAAFANALPVPLTAAERVHFDSLYRKQFYLGGLPLILIHDRFEFLREALIDVWDNPLDTVRVGALLRLLHYYGEMSAKRREGDRRYKARSGRLNNGSRVALILELNAASGVPTERQADLFQEIAAALRESRSASCRCGTTLRWHAELATKEVDADPFVIDDECETCGHRERVAVARDQFKKIGFEILQRSRPGEA